ncbi:MAG TPA: ArsB/NhaD family transporter [Dehalococcoidia bacterium]|nr:ArsB/NhaD family transporter [Dehalococcoidia bacterium]
MSEVQIALTIFLVTYAVIISEKVHKTTIALAGGMLVIAFRVLDTHQAFEAIDLDVIFLLVGMMIIANTMADTGVFRWMAIRSAKAANGSPIRVLILLCLITAVASAFLDNVTTVVLMAPVTLVVADTLGVKAVPMLIAEVLASNIGGTATLIGDPPNILVASHADIDFLTFAVNVGPVAVIALAAFLLVLPWLMRGQFEAAIDARGRVMQIDDSQLITDPRMLRIAGGVLGLVVLGFLFQGPLGYEPATVALMGATLLLLITRQDPHEALREVEWSTLFFFVGLFIVVGGLEEVGLLEDIGEWAADETGGSAAASSMLILWMSAILSGFVDNIPYTATMLPIVETMSGELDASAAPNLLWWSLAIGADMGGNLTIVAASANVLVANIAARNGLKITFFEFFRYGVLATAMTMAIASAYIWLRYFAF